MEALLKKARPIVYGGCGFLVFVFLIVAMTVNLMIVSVNINFFGTVISSTASYTLFASDFDNASGDCSKLGSMAKAARAFCILSILCVPPTWGLAALDLLGKQSLLGPLAPMFKFVMAGFGGLIVFFMIIAWPIMVALPSNASSCTGSSSVATFSVSAAPFIALVAWLVAIGMTVVPLVAPAPPSSAVPETSPQAVTGVAIVPAATPWLPNASPQYPQSAYQQQPQPQYQAYQPPQPARGQAQPKLDDFL